MKRVTPDVLIIGGGNAGLCAALTARECRASVLVLEVAPPFYRGGNSRHTRNLRCMHDGPLATLEGKYPESEYFDDLMRVTSGLTDERLARMTIAQSQHCPTWMSARGVRFQPSLGGTLQLGRTNAFFLGGGRALMNSYYDAATRLGIHVMYEAEVEDVVMQDGRFMQAHVRSPAGETVITAKAVVVAAGGFESNLEWLEEVWGPPARNFIVRGTPYNRGRVLRSLLAQGVAAVGDPKQGHAVAIDARAPRFDGGIVTRLDSITLGIVVNRNAERFYDEGEDFWPKRYAIWGSLVAAQPDQIAYSIIDSKAIGRFIPSVYPAITASSVREVADKLTLDPERLDATVRDFNASIRPGTFDHTVLDGCSTQALTPPKTHWAVPLDTPPYHAYPLRPGITFTYLGVRVDADARVHMSDDSPCSNVFAAGEIMAGNILGKGYLAGIGMTIGTVFGRIAGRQAATHATR